MPRSYSASTVKRRASLFFYASYFGEGTGSGIFASYFGGSTGSGIFLYSVTGGLYGRPVLI